MKARTRILSILIPFILIIVSLGLAGTSLAASGGEAATALTPDTLRQALLRSLTNALPAKVSVCRMEAGIISQDDACLKSANRAELESNLKKALQKASELNWADNQIALTQVAKDVSSSLSTTTNATPAPIVDAEKLARSIGASLKSSLPSSTHIDIEGEAGGIAAVCSVATNRDDLAERLEKQLALNSTLQADLSATLRKRVAADTVLSLFPPEPAATHARIRENQTGSPWQIRVLAGARLDNPYAINVSNGLGTLQPSSSTSDGYIEFELNNRYVERAGDTDDLIIWGQPTRPNGKPHFFIPFGRFPDVDTRVGYTFRGSSSSPTNFNVSTVVGGSDIYGDTSVGFAFAQVAGTDYSWKGQLSLEFAGGFATDKQHLDLHPNFFAGIGAQAAFGAPGFGSTNYQGFWCGRAGGALIDQPVLLSGTNTVRLNSLQEPDFD